MRRLWTKSEISLLKAIYPHNYTDVVCALMQRSTSSVNGMVYTLGLKKSPSFRKYELQRQADRLRKVGENGRFRKGHTPINKGKKMLPHVYAIAKRTMFKKGNKPHNTKYNGYERIGKDGYTEVRVKKGKYVAKHRLVWEKANGKVPAGHIVTFRDRNPLNIKLENLELITRKENMMRNTIQRFPAEVHSAIRLVNKLKRVIHEKQN